MAVHFRLSRLSAGFLPAVFLFLSVLPAFAAPEWCRQYDRGLSFLKTGKYEKALETFDHAVREEPHSLRAKRCYSTYSYDYFPYLQIARCYAGLGVLSKAGDFLDRESEEKAATSADVGEALLAMKVPPEAPAGVTAKPLSGQGGSKLLWSGSPFALDYEVQEAGDQAFTRDAATFFTPRSFLDVNFLEKGTRFYRVRARNPFQESPWSLPVSVDAGAVSAGVPEKDGGDTNLPFRFALLEPQSRLVNQGNLPIIFTLTADEEPARVDVQVEGIATAFRGLVPKRVKKEEDRYQYERQLLLQEGTNRMLFTVTFKGQEYSFGEEVYYSPYVPEQKNFYSRRWVVCLSIDHYQDTRFPPLRYPVRDAAKIQAALVKEYGYAPRDVIPIENVEATLGKVEEFFATQLPAKLRAGDSLLIIIAGHGVTSTAADGTKTGYFVMHDSREGEEAATMLSMAKLGEFCKGYPSRHNLILVDTCFGGMAGVTYRSSVSADFRYVLQSLSEPGTIFISAGGENEEVVESDLYGGSAFTYYLLEALKGKADFFAPKGFLSVKSELYPFLYNFIAGNPDIPQTPRMSSEPGSHGEYIFYRGTGR